MFLSGGRASWCLMRRKEYFINSICMLIASLLVMPSYAVDFNTDMLDSADKKNIDFSRFSLAGYIMPGVYQMGVIVNSQEISPSPFQILFVEPPSSNAGHNDKIPQACLTPEIVNLMGMTEASLEKVLYWGNEHCADFSQLSGVEISPNQAEGMLYINMPQLWLEYSDDSWLPPSRWDNGISGVLFDYNINGSVNKPYKGEQEQQLSYNGTAGANWGAWRLRADYQGNLSRGQGEALGGGGRFSWNRFYMYRAIPRWGANLTLGENYTNSDIFSSWRYTGISLESDARMLPPKLRGYAPMVSGIADTNARVVISQQGRILYDSTVPAGPFSIQDLDSSVRGRLDVSVIEQDGRKQTFQVDTAYVPYLTRPGQIRYKFVAGRSRSYIHTTEGPVFTAGEISWGLSNAWSLYGGGVVAGDYNALAVGVAHDLNVFGTVSADITQSVARMPETDPKQGKSWRLSYSKRFDDVNTDITFAGYRFSERNYMTMEQYINARYHGDFSDREKELYTITLHKGFDSWNSSVNFQYSHQTYWDSRTSDYYSVSLNRYFDLFDIKNISLGVSASRSQYHNKDNDSVYIRLSVPWGSGTASYNSSVNNGSYVNSVGYSDFLQDGLSSYSLNAGVSSSDGRPSGGQIGAYYSHSSPEANLSVNFSAAENNYTSFGISASGGGTITPKGAAIHAGGMNGSTRLLVDTDGVGGVPIDGGRVLTNRWGIGVVTDLSSYYRNTISVDLNKLPENIEATRSVVESVLTEGAIGYREFGILKGERLFAVLNMSDNSQPPFGASVMSNKGVELGMVTDGGLVWLSGINPGERITVGWDGKKQCVADIPERFNPEQQLLLPCKNIY